MNPRQWFWVHVFLAFVTLAWTMTTVVLGEPPPPLLLLIGIIQALIFQSEWESSTRENAAK